MKSVATAALVTTNPPGQQSGPIYKYSGGYSVATTLDPGYGYWIKLYRCSTDNHTRNIGKGWKTSRIVPRELG